MLLIYLTTNASRCSYVLDLIFKEELGLAFKTCADIHEFKQFSGEKVNYSDERIGDEFFIKCNSILFETGIKKQEVKVAIAENEKILFPCVEDDLGFDIFSSVFFMVSRYEEYLPFEGDKFGRFRHQDSLAFQNEFLQKPAVNIWIEIFKNKLARKFPTLQFAKKKFSCIVTYDIDVAYKYKGRSFGRNVGSTLKDVFFIRIKNLFQRFQTLLLSKNDPWDVYDYLQQLLYQNQLPSVFFFLLADKSSFDRNLNHENAVVKNLVKKIQSFTQLGIHPSFFTSEQQEKMVIEKERLENISISKISKSRQHFLKFNLPGTFNSLLSAGIVEDYSMGFAGMPGFRAGTCTPFYFYDLESDIATSLKMMPVICMDATFVYYVQKSPEKSLVDMLRLMKEVEKVKGIFIPIFHNDIIVEFISWKKVHEQLIRQMKSSLNKS
ncbi:MAG: polysaccharide deacetylase family protein [Ginsengibacter sp.]